MAQERIGTRTVSERQGIFHRVAPFGRSVSSVERAYDTHTIENESLNTEGREQGNQHTDAVIGPLASRLTICGKSRKLNKRKPKNSSVKLYADLLCQYDVHLACDLCVNVGKDSEKCTLSNDVKHTCPKNRLVLLERSLPDFGYLIRNRPLDYVSTTTHQLCEHVRENELCLERQLCPFPHTFAERDLWDEDLNGKVSIASLIADLRESTLRVKQLVQYLCEKHCGTFELACEKCYKLGNLEEMGRKRRHRPQCLRKHTLTGSQLLVFRGQEGLVVFDEQSNYLKEWKIKLIECIKAIKVDDTSDEEIALESRKLAQKALSRGLKGIDIKKRDEPAAGDGNVSQDSDDDVHLAKTDKDIFDLDGSDVLNEHAFDDDTGDKNDPTGGSTPSGDDYYKLLTKERVELALHDEPYVYCIGLIRLNGPFNATCKIRVGGLSGYVIKLVGRVNCGPACDGDDVVVKVLQPPLKNAYCGTVVHVLKRNVHRTARTYVCTTGQQHGTLMTPLCGTVPRFLIVDKCLDKRFDKDKKGNFVAVYDDDAGLKLKKIVKLDALKRKEILFIVKYLKWTNAHRYPLGYVCRVIRNGSCGVDASQKMLDILYEIPQDIPLKMILGKDDEDDFVKLEGPDDEKRKDLTGLLTFSIDPEECCKMDDALSVEIRDANTVNVWVHIADVTHYVAKDDEDDQILQRRLVSFNPCSPREVHHMLPEKLARKCSLTEGKCRRALSVCFQIDRSSSRPKPLSMSDFEPAWIKNTKQFTHKEVQNIIDQQSHAHTPVVGLDNGLSTLSAKVWYLHSIARALRERRMGDKQHFYEFDNKQDLNCLNPFDIDQHHDAHRLVEELMVLTNREVGRLLASKFPDCTPFVCQEEPASSMLANWKKNYGWIVPHSYYFSLMHVEGQLNQGTHDVIMLRSSWIALKKALQEGNVRKVRTIIGSEELHPIHKLARLAWFRIQEKPFYCCGSQTHHFDLQISNYTHFTSPIRQYADIIVHRLIKAAAKEESSCPYKKEEIVELCRQINVRESMKKRYNDCCSLLQMAELLREPIYVPCFVDRHDDFRLQVVSPFFLQSDAAACEFKYSHLTVTCTPTLSGVHDDLLKLTWQKRMYDTRKTETAGALNKTQDEYCLDSNMFGFRCDSDGWGKVHRAVKNFSGKILCNTLIPTVKYLNAGLQNSQNVVQEVTSELSETGVFVKHHVKFSLQVQPGSVLWVQLGSSARSGFLQPVIKLLKLTHEKDLCLEHRIEPVKAFAKVATQKTKPKYEDIEEYQRIWRAILDMESATNAVVNDDSVVCGNVPLRLWMRNGIIYGKVKLNKKFCDERHITVYNMTDDVSHDFVCIRYQVSGSGPDHKRRLIRNVWVGHALVIQSKRKTDDENAEIKLTLKVCQSNYPQPPRLRCQCTMEFMPRTLPDKLRIKGHSLFSRRERHLRHFRVDKQDHVTPHIHEDRITLYESTCVKRMAQAVSKLQKSSTSELCRRIVLGSNLKDVNDSSAAAFIPRSDYSLTVFDRGELEFLRNNKSQIAAIHEAMTKRFTLIQGPPVEHTGRILDASMEHTGWNLFPPVVCMGTGKTLVGVNIAYLYTKQNQLNANTADKIRKQVLFCGPSNSSVDAAAKQMWQRLYSVKPAIIRVYGEMHENLDYPIPRDILKPQKKKDKEDEVLNQISLHNLIRESGKTFSRELREFDELFRANLNSPENVSEEDIYSYRKLVAQASREELKSYDIIFCTCSISSSNRIRKGTNVVQLIIDECAMCMEPETLIPLVAFKNAKRIVLIGDHKQLQPIVMNNGAKDLGLGTSLFERYAKSTVMLDEQYRMHAEICKFPSKYFYKSRLRTAENSRWFRRKDHIREIWPNSSCPMVFCHVQGVEVSQPVSTPEGSEQSKSNEEERNHIRRIIKELVKTLKRLNPDGSPEREIAVLSQYKAQCSAVIDDLKREELGQCSVSTVVASQGNEWDYVILSTVRSVSEYEMDPKPSIGWCNSKMGFITDEHQINVALTRARIGLIIVGNKKLLRCHPMWRNLLERFEKKNCVMDAENFLCDTIRPVKAEHEIPGLN